MYLAANFANSYEALVSRQLQKIQFHIFAVVLQP